MYRRIRDLREEADKLQKDIAAYLSVHRSVTPTMKWVSVIFLPMYSLLLQITTTPALTI